MKFLFSINHLIASIQQAPEAIKVLASTPAFILKHKLWKGFLDNKWVFVFSLIIATLFSIGLYGNFHDYFFPPHDDIEIPTEGLNVGISNLEEAATLIPEIEDDSLEAGIESLKKTKNHLEGDHKPLFTGGLKFLLLILLEVIIFHFSVKTNNILKDQNVKPKFKSFSKAQVRMLKVMIRKWLYVLILYIIASILFSIIGQKWLRGVFMFIIYAYYFGFAFFDNYLEQFGLSIKQSAKHINESFGAATIFGLFASGLMTIPIIGPLLAPFICAIATTRYGHQFQMEDFYN